ncbi:MAG: putative leader peptide [Candidatus Nanopelagicales bacterium]
MHRRPALTSRRHVDLGRVSSQMCRMPGMRPCDRP